MVKLQQKISGTWRTFTGARNYCRAAQLHLDDAQARSRRSRRTPSIIPKVRSGYRGAPEQLLETRIPPDEIGAVMSPHSSSSGQVGIRLKTERAKDWKLYVHLERGERRGY